MEALKEHRRKLFAERSDRWEEWKEHGLVFPSRCGTPMEPDNLRRSWGAIRKAAGLGEMRFHDLRHTCVTLLLNLGVPPQVVRDIVGHSDIEVTDDLRSRIPRRQAQRTTQARRCLGLIPSSALLEAAAHQGGGLPSCSSPSPLIDVERSPSELLHSRYGPSA
ncbi:tyrosine-type recombinase/integrase [Actinomadura sp. ATCC 31491]|uniref:Tyrosine-type recombinase/integrase n=1 Tax=Actinomadura luzonensis TaxID=2805427 RepID=A0ABT0FMW4_9ACTN|nr:site-specific integrase [Actinomadura luzonensis]MCK2213684.1 tyrosine-type recombinase/integrase [Actinomadura luzonensis]